MDSDDDTKQCCGSGCNNCILDEYPRNKSRGTEIDSKLNILSQNYVPFRIDKIENCTENVSIFFLSFKSAINLDLTEYTLNIPPGHHIMIRTECTTAEYNLTDKRYDTETELDYISRWYTPIRVDSAYFKFEILVKFEVNGLMSKYFQKCVPGDICEVKGVYGNFTWVPHNWQRLLCISQGVAIAPMFRVIQSILDNEEDETRIQLYACYKDCDSILMRPEIIAFQQYWNFQSAVYLSNHKCCCYEQVEMCTCLRNQLKYNERVHSKRLDFNELFNYFNSNNADINSNFILICGTDVFINSIKNYLKKLNINEDNIFVFQ